MLSFLNLSESEYLELGKNYYSKYTSNENNAEKIADEISYYLARFNNVLIQNRDKKMQKMTDADQLNIREKMLMEQTAALSYAHQKGFDLLWTTLFLYREEFKPEGFRNPEQRTLMLQMMYDQYQSEEFEKNIRRESVATALIYAHKYFESIRSRIMEDVFVFIKKGAALAYDILLEHMGITFEDTGKSQLLNVPFDLPFQVTPAFQARFGMEKGDIERWDIQWDSLIYGSHFDNQIVARLIIWKLDYQEILSFENKNVQQYYSILQHLKSIKEEGSNFVEYEPILYCEYFPSNDKEGPRPIDPEEYRLIYKALQREIAKRSSVRPSNIIVSI